MRRTLLAVVAVGTLAVVSAQTLSAQGVRWGVGAGLLMPMGDYNDIDKMGFVVGGGGTYWLTGGQLGIRADLSYGQTSHDGVDGTTKVIGGLASVVYALGPSASSARPYLMGGLGFYNVDIETGGVSGSESKIAFGGGVGVSIKMGTGGSRIFLETRYTNVSTDPAWTFLPIVVGVSFGK